MKKVCFAPHTISLCFLFVFSSVVATSFKNNVAFNFYSAILSLAITYGVYFLIKHYKNKKLLLSPFCVGACVIAFYSVAVTLSEFFNFLKIEQMPRAHSFLTFAALLPFLLFAFFNINALYKYCLFAAIISVLIILICFLCGIKNFSVSTANPIFDNAQFSLKLFFKYFSAIFILPFLCVLKPDNCSFKYTITGCFAGFLGVFITVFQTLFTLGDATCNFAYFNAVSVISTGSIFSRLNGLVFLLFFISSFVKINVCIKIIQIIVKFMLSNKPIQN